MVRPFVQGRTMNVGVWTSIVLGTLGVVADATFYLLVATQNRWVYGPNAMPVALTVFAFQAAATLGAMAAFGFRAWRSPLAAIASALLLVGLNLTAIAYGIYVALHIPSF